MAEPTDRGLAVQGLTRGEYDALSPEGKAIIADRSRRLVELANITLAAELLNTIAESDDSSRAYIAEVIGGKHPDFEEKLRSVIREYLDADVNSSIRDFYKIKYGSAGIVSRAGESEGEARRVEAASAPQPTLASQPQTVKPPRAAAAPQAVLSKPTPPTTAEGRRKNVAVILSQLERRNVDSVMKTESDIIDAIMRIVDDNGALGLTDEIVINACEALIKEGSGIQFRKEALMPEHRERLLEVAKTFTGK